MFDDLYGRRLDRLDYENAGIALRWSIRRAIQLLICFEMEVKGYFDLESAETIYGKLWTKYQTFIFQAIKTKAFPFDPAIPEALRESAGEFEMDDANFKRLDFINYLSSNNHVNVDLAKLLNVLAGDEVAGLVIAIEQPANTWHLISPEQTRKPKAAEVDYDEPLFVVPEVVVHGQVASAPIDIGYRFERSQNGWSLQFGDAKLVGVKDWLGMSYIKTLLGNPGVKISVLDLQRIAGDSGNEGQHDYEEHGNCYEDDDSASYGGVAAWDTIDATAKGTYRNRLEVIAAEITDARNAGNQTKVDALIEEAEFIRKELQQSNFKPKDPEIDKNRKRVTKAINDTIKNISKLEGAYGYCDRPISGHLNRYVQKGSFCSYTASADKLPDWRF